jgi:hypothetical protein
MNLFAKFEGMSTKTCAFAQLFAFLLQKAGRLPTAPVLNEGKASQTG